MWVRGCRAGNREQGSGTAGREATDRAAGGAEKGGSCAEGGEKRVPGAKALFDSAPVMPGLKSRPISETGTSEAGTSETGTSETGISETGKSEAGISETGTSEAGTSGVGWGAADGGAEGAEKGGACAEGGEERVPGAKALFDSAPVMPGLKSRPSSETGKAEAGISETGTSEAGTSGVG